MSRYMYCVVNRARVNQMAGRYEQVGRLRWRAQLALLVILKSMNTFYKVCLLRIRFV